VKRKTKIPQYVADTLPPEFFQRIGEIVFIGGRIEYQLSRIIARGFKLTNDAERALVIGMQLSTLCGNMRTLAYDEKWISDADLRADIEALAERVQANSGNRNAYAHAVVGYDEKAPSSLYMYLWNDKKHKSSPEKLRITKKSLQLICDESRQILRESIDITQRLIAFQGISP